MDIVTLGAALNGSAEYVNSHFKGGSNIQIVDNPDGTQTINASGEVSAEDTVAREAIVEHVLDKANPHEVTATQLGLGNVNNTSDIDKPVSTAMQTALNAKANTTDVYSKNEVDTALSSKQNVITDLADIRSGATLGSTAVQPVSGKGLSTNDYTTTEKNKLAGIEAQANKTTVDSSLSGTSTNPVQNKVVKSALDGKQATLSTAQLAAINSGITYSAVTQIETNKNNISKIHNPANVYFSETAPTGTIPMQSYWISSTGVHVYGDDVYGATLEQGSFETFSGAEITANNRVRTTFDSQAPTGTYTVSAEGADDVVIYAYTSNTISSWSNADSVTAWQSMPYTFTTAQNLYLRFAFRQSDNTAIAPSDVSNVKVIAHKWSE